MRLLVVGKLNGQLSTAVKMAMSAGAKVSHVETCEAATHALRAGQGGVEGLGDAARGGLRVEGGRAVAEIQGERVAAEGDVGADLEAVFDVPVTVSAVLGKSAMEVSQLLKLGRGTIVELDRKVGEAIDIYVNNRLVARGEVVIVDERLGVTMTEIIKGEDAAA